MKDQFIPYELALELKILGFDGESFARYRKGVFQLNVLGKPLKHNSEEIVTDDVSAPLWQQALDWFEDKHHITSYITYDFILYDVYIYDFRGPKEIQILSMLSVKGAPCLCSIYDARKACLERIIEIIKSHK